MDTRGSGQQRCCRHLSVSRFDGSCHPWLADPDYNPATAARQERKARKLKNEAQNLKNLSRAAGSAAAAAPSSLNQTASQQVRAAQAREEKSARKRELEGLVQTTHRSTASMGKFDKRLEGEGKPKGVKRKVRFYFLFPRARTGRELT